MKYYVEATSIKINNTKHCVPHNFAVDAPDPKCASGKAQRHLLQVIEHDVENGCSLDRVAEWVTTYEVFDDVEWKHSVFKETVPDIDLYRSGEKERQYQQDVINGKYLPN